MGGRPRNGGLTPTEEVIGEMETDGTLDALKAQYIDDVIAGDDPEKVIPEMLDDAETFKVALTGDRPPMDYFSDAGEPIGFNTAYVMDYWTVKAREYTK